MASSLWPNLISAVPRRGMVDMLYDAAGDVAQLTNNKVDFHVETVGIGGSGLIQNIRHNCYLRVVAKAYAYLLFQVKTPVTTPFDADLSTPEGDTFSGIKDENQLRDMIRQVLQRQRTSDVLHFLLNMAPNVSGSSSITGHP